ncbi:hypothetical protein KO488_02135 [Poseidonibacter lekithochrous]|uniref:hypothetical protein n=1 Tax=Poseidonibacter TaxID=2321187 RepID=UPI001C095D0A|nr:MULTISPECIES: hypothetical protein [Poseidonibacter]MBU3013540.1 hypothetical protein [Poseidonibacter lekithochrous]MDO6826837.1 hypothetical protein [Poseidonibacter sp. 1_MG-2023]
MLHYFIIFLLVLFCSYELLPKNILDFALNIVRKLARIYEQVDSKIQLENIDYYKTQKSKRTKIKKVSNWFFRTIFLSLAFIIIVFWDFFWHMLFKRIFSYLHSLRIYDKFKIYIRQKANKYFVLLIFIFLFVIMESFGVYSGILTIQGHIILAILSYMAKFLMVFPVKVLYEEGHDKLVEIPWFDRRKKLFVSFLLWFETTSSYKKAKELFYKLKLFLSKIKNKFKRNKQYRFIFQFKAYRRLLKIKRLKSNNSLSNKTT